MVLFVWNLLMNGIYILKCFHLSLLKIRVINLVKICNIIVQRSQLHLQSATVQKTYIPLNGNKKHVYKYNNSFIKSLVLFSIKTRFSPWMKTHRGPPHPVTTEAIDLRFIVFVELKPFKEHQAPPKIQVGGSTIVHLRLVKLQIKMEFISGYNC